MADFSCRQPAMDPADFGAAFWPQLMIDGQRADLPAPFARPAIGQKGERQAVGASGDGDGQERGGFEMRERGERGAKLGEGQRFGLRSAGQQPSRFFSAAARSLILLPEVGKSRSSCASATQAFCFWLARASDMPSFKRSSAAFVPFG